MTVGPIVLAASVLVIIGILIGSRFTQWQLKTRARRQTAAQRSLSRQLLGLRPQGKEITLIGRSWDTRKASSNAEPRADAAYQCHHDRLGAVDLTLKRLRLGPPRWWLGWWVTWRLGEARVAGLG